MLPSGTGATGSSPARERPEELSTRHHERVNDHPASHRQTWHQSWSLALATVLLATMLTGCSEGTSPPGASQSAATSQPAQSPTSASPQTTSRTADAALLDAAVSGQADQADRAIKAGAAVEARDPQGRTPLLLAVTHDRVEVASLLVAKGADPDALDAQHDTPWLVTGVTGSVRMLEVLLPAKPDLTIRNRFGGTSVIPASERGHVEYVRRVVRTGINVNHVNDLGWTAMLEAVILGDGSIRYQQIVTALLAAGADPSIGDKNGVTPLEHSQDRGHDEIASIIRRATAK